MQRSFPKNVTREIVPVINIRQVPESLDLMKAVSPRTWKFVFWIFVLGFTAIVAVQAYQIIITKAFLKDHQ